MATGSEHYAILTRGCVDIFLFASRELKGAEGDMKETRQCPS